MRGVELWCREVQTAVAKSQIRTTNRRTLKKKSSRLAQVHQESNKRPRAEVKVTESENLSTASHNVIIPYQGPFLHRVSHLIKACRRVRLSHNYPPSQG